MKSQHRRARIAGLETFTHNSRRKPQRGAILGNLLEQVVMGVEEERKARGKVINIQTSLQRRFNVSDTVRERESDFLHCSRTRFTYVVTANRNRVPVGHFAGTVGEDVGNQTQRGPWWIDVSAARDVLLQNVVLQRAFNFVKGNVLLARYCQVEAKQRGSSCVDGHRSRNAIERNAVKQAQHVFQ